MIETETVEVLRAILEVIIVTGRKKNFFANVIENILFEILLPKTTPIIIGITCRPLSQINLLETV